jgi:calcineurin-like phosphoesterase
MSFHLDGRVSALVGSHTHVQTTDALVTPEGTGYITDAGMCGPVKSVIGMDAGDVLRRFLTQVPTRFEVAPGEAEAAGVFFDITPETGACGAVEAFVMSETMMRSREAWTRF